MKDNRITLNNFAILYQSYIRAISASANIREDGFMHWCKEDDTLDALRENAERALDAYVSAIAEVYFKEEREIATLLDKSDKVNLSNLFKKKD